MSTGHASADSIELASQHGSTNRVIDESIAGSNMPQGPQYQSLPPTDEGYQAWVALFGAFLSNGLIWGFALSFGVMQEYYTSNEPFSSKPGGIAAIGTTCTGLMYLTMPVCLFVFQRHPGLRKMAMYVSLPTVAVALVGASFAKTVPQLLVMQGVIYAIAGNALVIPTINYLNEWFVRKKGLAIGVAIAGDGVGGAILPLVLQALLSAVGFRWTLRIVAAILVVLASPLLFVLKPRLPVSAAQASPRIDPSFLRSPLFWVLQAANTSQALGYFLPINYLPTIAEALGLSSTLGSLTTTLINTAMVFGCIGVGTLVDRFDVTKVLLILSVIATITVFAILGVTTSVAPLFVFSVMYGLTASAYSTSWAGMIRDIQRKHDGADANLVFGLFAAGRGVGSIISGPLSEALLEKSKGFSEAAGSTYGSEYGPIIIFSGCTAVAGGLSWFVRRAGLI
ncbi:MFS transporter asaE [Fulvia fulva]|uniref:MFS transporter asaE n=1 Tax=Passalora fulva TaxID=5499 RepID=A0A9Q8PAX2_PASFU|nr:MFS transporter asaE [Fulvia fulva]KAK4622274.1 MFS transporter asaE [Fulvia fulva]KAK4623023.1 MFS transporter asaE [Fulvia fulva]UJO19080.1 MFS transporter asaE [Fulvia fulva]WPV15853.1 MFS transporter asaE [Fulvia fulva]WPV31410.1 MFS transporter asaE [Fulvia fulva]